MLEDMRKYMRLGLEALGSQASDDAGAARRSRAHLVAEQLSTLAAGFLDWSSEARASLLAEIKDLVARQVQEMGVATKKDLESLVTRLERLEAGLPAGNNRGGRATRGRSAAKAKSPAAAKAKSSAKGKAKSSAKPKSSRATAPTRSARGPR